MNFKSILTLIKLFLKILNKKLFHLRDQIHYCLHMLNGGSNILVLHFIVII